MNGVALSAAVRATERQSVVFVRSSLRSLCPYLHRWAGLLLSLAVFAAVGMQLGSPGIVRAIRAAPADLGFWLMFAAFYLLTPACEWTIFRRLWKVPVAGLIALLRKQVANELVLGYSGEAQFYLWARRHAHLSTSPFGAVKDVAVLSAVVGNLFTLTLMVANFGLLADLFTGPLGRTFAGSAGLIALSSLAIFLLRGRLLSLPRADLIPILVTQAGRIIGSMMLLAALWHLLLPGLPVQALFVLAALRMMVSRLPLLPAKDVIFAGLVAVLLGRNAAAVPAIALLASLTIAAHVLVAICVAVAGIIGETGAR